MRPIDRPQQIRLQFRAVFLQIQQRTRLQSYLLVAIGEHDKLAATRLSNEFSKLSLGFPNGNRFHAAKCNRPHGRKQRLPLN